MNTGRSSCLLRRLDCVLADTKQAVLKKIAEHKGKEPLPAPVLQRAAKQNFYNTSKLDMQAILNDQSNIRKNLYAYLQAFSPAARDIFERFDFHSRLERLDKNGLLYLVVEKFAAVDLHPDKVDNGQMGLAFEELIRKFAELSNETAGEHFTPRDVIRLMVDLIFIEDDDVLEAGKAVVRSIYDPTAGTGGMLTQAEEHLTAHNPQARLRMFGQELNDESYAICKADLLIKGQEIENIVPGNTLSDDGHAGRKFDYMLANPPYGVEWKKVEAVVRKEHENKGYDGRFGPGLPRVSDGSMLFLLHMVSKMLPAKDGGARIGIVLNGSPLFTGGAGSGESEIRRHLLESDLVEAIIGLPTDMFYNTGIATYVWILSNRKPGAERQGAVDRRLLVLAKDPEIPRQQAEGTVGTAHCRHRPLVRRRRCGTVGDGHRRRREGTGAGHRPRGRKAAPPAAWRHGEAGSSQPHSPERQLRLPHHHCGAAVAG